MARRGTARNFDFVTAGNRRSEFNHGYHGSTRIETDDGHYDPDLVSRRSEEVEVEASHTASN